MLLVLGASDGYQTRLGGQGADKELRRIDEQPALSSPTKSELTPSLIHAYLVCALATLFLDEVVPGDHLHSVTPKSTHSGVTQIWVQVPAPRHISRLCRLPNAGDGETGVSLVCRPYMTMAPWRIIVRIK